MQVCVETQKHFSAVSQRYRIHACVKNGVHLWTQKYLCPDVMHQCMYRGGVQNKKLCLFLWGDAKGAEGKVWGVQFQQNAISNKGLCNKSIAHSRSAAISNVDCTTPVNEGWLSPGRGHYCNRFLVVWLSREYCSARSSRIQLNRSLVTRE